MNVKYSIDSHYKTQLFQIKKLQHSGCRSIKLSFVHKSAIPDTEKENFSMTVPSAIQESENEKSSKVFLCQSPTCDLFQDCAENFDVGQKKYQKKLKKCVQKLFSN